MAKKPGPARSKARPSAKEQRPARQKITAVVTTDPGTDDEETIEYPLYPDTITRRHELELHIQTGLSSAEALNPPNGWTGPFIVTLVWFSLKTQGQRLSWDDAALLVPLGCSVTVIYGEPSDDSDDDDEAGDGAPKAPAGD